jgi:hypothetical protein
LVSAVRKELHFCVSKNTTESFGKMPFVDDFISVLEDCRDMASRTSTYNMEFTWEYVKYCLYLRKSCHVDKDSTGHYRCRLGTATKRSITQRLCHLT